MLYGELGQIPGEDQLREYVDNLRKRDGKAKIGRAGGERCSRSLRHCRFPENKGRAAIFSFESLPDIFSRKCAELKGGSDPGEGRFQ